MVQKLARSTVDLRYLQKFDSAATILCVHLLNYLNVGINTRQGWELSRKEFKLIRAHNLCQGLTLSTASPVLIPTIKSKAMVSIFVNQKYKDQSVSKQNNEINSHYFEQCQILETL